jgi:hypothetical protein
MQTCCHGDFQAKRKFKITEVGYISTDGVLSISFSNFYRFPTPPAPISHSSARFSCFINLHKVVEVLCGLGDSSCPTGRIINLRRRNREQNESKSRRPNYTAQARGGLGGGVVADISDIAQQTE